MTDNERKAAEIRSIMRMTLGEEAKKPEPKAEPKKEEKKTEEKKPETKKTEKKGK